MDLAPQWVLAGWDSRSPACLCSVPHLCVFKSVSGFATKETRLQQRLRGLLGGEGGETAWAGRGGRVGGPGVHTGLFLPDVMWEGGVHAREENQVLEKGGGSDGKGEATVTAMATVTGVPQRWRGPGALHAPLCCSKLPSPGCKLLAEAAHQLVEEAGCGHVTDGRGRRLEGGLSLPQASWGAVEAEAISQRTRLVAPACIGWGEGCVRNGAL